MTTGLVLLDKILVIASVIEGAYKAGKLLSKVLSKNSGKAKRGMPLRRPERSYA